MKRNPVSRLFFKYDMVSNFSTCQINNCNFKMKGNHSSTLERHIQAFHKEQFIVLQEEKLSQPNLKKQKVNLIKIY